MTAVFHRQPKHPPSVAQRGDGVYLFDAQGRRYLDGSGGAAVSCLGHGHPRIIEAIVRQAQSLAFAHTAFLSSEPAEALAEWLCDRAPAGIGKVYFLSGGSEATETALKLARQYHVARGESERSVFISRRQSYHGNTLGALAVSGNVGRRVMYEPLLMQWERIAPCYAYREQT
jgi:adenosylmethionine-8-amino-7-oxononanoate aminotransferase